MHPADRLTEDEKITLIRDLTDEYVSLKATLPRSKKPLEFNVDGSWDRKQWMEAARAMGYAARFGDKVQITKISFEGDHMVLEINNGLKSGQHWYDRIQVDAGVSGGPLNSNNSGTASAGTYIDVNFHKPMENLNSAEVKKILAPIFDFDPHSVTKLYSETLPPEMQKAVAEKRAIAGMDRDEVLLAMGHPDHKYRETKDGVDSEDWIYGKPPGKVTFVTFAGSKVTKVKEEYAGLGSEVAQQQTITP